MQIVASKPPSAGIGLAINHNRQVDNKLAAEPGRSFIVFWPFHCGSKRTVTARLIVGGKFSTLTPLTQQHEEEEEVSN
jgi:hypothetical protein